MNRALLAALALLAAGCGDGAPKIRVGAKAFAEQEILAEAAVQRLRDRGLPVAPVVKCGDTYRCQRMLRDGRLDVMIDYSGTGLSFLGEPAPAGGDALARARALYAPLGLVWLGRLGFDNGYRLVVTTERAAAGGLSSIADLEKIEGGVRFTCPPDYVRRPRDGLAALVQRYGLRVAGSPRVLAGVDERMRTLRDGRADVAVAYATDGALVGMGVTVLTDPARFFPPYDGAFVVQAKSIERWPELIDALRAFEGRLDDAAMQRLNYAVEVESRSPAEVAAGWLRASNLVEGEGGGGHRRPELVIVRQRDDRLGELATRGVRAVRAAFPGRPLVVKAVADPAERVAAGKARLAVIGAERFFHGEADGRRRERRIEAVAVVGTRVLHVVRRATDAGEPLSGRVGLPPAGSGAARIGALVLEGRPVSRRDAPAALLDAVAAGELDAALLVAEPGDALLARRLGDGSLTPRALPGWLTPERAVGAPYIRMTRIPAGTYGGQHVAVETVGAQVVLAGAAPRAGPAMAGGGPASALPSGGRPLEPAQVEALAAATGVAEAPDPVLPTAWARAADARPAARTSDRLWGTVLNVLALAFLAWLVIEVRRPA